MHSLIGTGGALLLSFVRHASTFLPTIPKPGFATRTSRDPHPDHSGTMRALTPAGLARPGRSLRLLCIAVRTSRPQPRHDLRMSLSQSPQRARSGLATQASPSMSRLAKSPPPKRVRYPTGCSFASGCSPPRIAATQLPPATQVVTSYGLDSHQPDNATSRTHSWPCRRPSTTSLSKGGVEAA